MNRRPIGRLAFCLLLLAGCASSRGEFRRALRTDFVAATHARDLAAGYRVYQPDVLEIDVAGRPECCGRRPVRLDGSIAVAPGVSPRVEGQSALQIAAGIARQLHVPETQVQVRVAEHNSQSLYLFGQTGELPPVVEYRGPETVLDLFKRLPGAAKLSEVGEVHVVRSHVADGKPPEVFQVDLGAILNKDLQTNVRLEPSDRISIGQTKRSQFREVMPPWLRALTARGGLKGRVRQPDRPPSVSKD